MNNRNPLIRQLEIAIFCLFGAVGSFYCGGHHWDRSAHLAHGQHAFASPWIVDSVWIFGISGAAVVGLRGGFLGARLTGFFCACIIGMMVTASPPSPWLPAFLFLGPLFVFHLFSLMWHVLKQKQAKQAVPSDGHKPPNHASSTNPTAPADAH